MNGSSKIKMDESLKTMTFTVNESSDQKMNESSNITVDESSKTMNGVLKLQWSKVRKK